MMDGTATTDILAAVSRKIIVTVQGTQCPVNLFGQKQCGHKYTVFVENI
jgi:hypothetical protein